MTKLFRAVLSLVGWLFIASAVVQAQAPNDNFANAWTLTGTYVTTNGSNVGTSKEANEPNHAGNLGGRSVWFNWTAPTNGFTRINTLGSSFNTLLGVYTGNSVGGLSMVATNDNYPGLGNASQVEFNAVAGTTYRIAIDASRGFFGVPNGGTYFLELWVLASVSITSVTNNQVIYKGTPIPLDVIASVPNPPVRRVDFYRAGLPIGSDTNAPYSLTYTNAPHLTNSFYAVAVDNASMSWTSAVVTVNVLNIGMTITAPVDGSTYLVTNNINVTAVASVPGGGAVTNVEFFVDDIKFGQDATAPFSAIWTSPPGGVHRLTVVGRHVSGILYTSTPVTVSLPRILVPTGSVWKYLDNGSDQGTNWIAVNYDDSLWQQGPAELGYGDGDEATVVDYGPDPNDRYITTYFRHAFFVTNAINYTNLIPRVKRDDGAVVYLNGIELQRLNMPFGVITNRSLGLLAGDDGASYYGGNFPATLLREGKNVLAVEIHQNHPTSDDLSFDLQLQGVLTTRNQAPLVFLTSPADQSTFLAPPTIGLTATANDSDGSISRVQFLANGLVLGQDEDMPYSVVWNNPPLGWHVLRAIAFDDFDASAASAEVAVTVYDAAGTPLVEVTAPVNDTVVEGPTNMLVSARASAPRPIANVQFLANGIVYAIDSDAPYEAVWSAPFGSNVLTAIATDNSGLSGTSSVVAVTITIPPTNTVPPFVLTATPAPSVTVNSLTSVRVTFSEVVFGVDASDLLLNGVPATQVTSTGGTNYNFTVSQPAYGTVTVTWAADHGISDFGWPSNLPFDHTGVGATWTYNLVDRTAPTVLAKNPAANAVLSNLTEVTVTFSEPVNGVDATDFFVNGVPAFGMSGAGATYTFSFSQPPAGAVSIDWSFDHGIADQAVSPNAFNATGTGARWSYVLDNRTVLVQSNSAWSYFKAFGEASNPIDAWRQLDFSEDGSWSSGLAPFFVGDPYGSTANPGTLLNDMLGAYSGIYLRRTFTVADPNALTALFLAAQSDDGFIAWINGVEVMRFNAPAGEVPYSGTAVNSVNEPNNNGAAYSVFSLPNPEAYLRTGENVIAVHALNQSLNNSSDFGFNAQLYTFIFDPSVVIPRIVNVTPPAGSVFSLTNVIIQFSEPVSGVDASDLLVNSVPATAVTSVSNIFFTFSFPQPPFGNVWVTWTNQHSIVDFDSPPKPFNHFASESSFFFNYLNPSTPTVASQVPLRDSTRTELRQITVTFSEPVRGVDAADLIINGLPATSMTGAGANYTFAFPQPSYGWVSVGWSFEHNIEDLQSPANAFDLTREGSNWYYILEDKSPPAIVLLDPPAGAIVTNLTRVSVAFSEEVAGVNASDLLVNGVPATSLTSFGPVFTFHFAQPNATFVSFTWANNHGIRDFAAVPNTFDPTAPGSTWSYSTPDTVAPALGSIDPLPFVTVRALAQIRVTFTEPVTGVSSNDLLINNIPARQVNGSGAGPYNFSFLPPLDGVVSIRWANNHGIADLGTPSNPFMGGEWSYTLDPNASFAGKVVINEIMFNPAGGLPAEEWIELRNVSAEYINLTGWRFSRGVDFQFPEVSIEPGGYLVVAADVASFQAKYPGITNVVGGWTGRLSNSEEEIELETVLGEVANTVHYATEGDWAQRERGGGAERVESIIRNGSTATVFIFAHGYTSGGGNTDEIIISGADQPEYNGRFTVGNVGPTSFTFTVPGTPASPATGNIICRLASDNGVTGWSWFSAADGFGSSLELVNATLPNAGGQNWLPSSVQNGTPGRPNSVTASDLAPLVQDVRHFPPVPRSTDPVTITARVQDEIIESVQVALFYRNASTATVNAFTNVAMFDDGGHNDGAAGDGLYGVVLPPMANRTVIEFYVQGTDETSRVRSWPAPARDLNGSFAQVANALFQVDDEVITNNMPIMRLVMTGAERSAFPPSSRNSDAEMNVTLVSSDGEGQKIRYLSGVRVRGAGSRSRTPPNNRLNIPNDNLWNGKSAVNLNAHFVHAQLMGSAVAKRAGVAASDARLVQYRINAVNPAPIAAPVNGSQNGAGYGTFILVEPVNGDLAENLFPEDGDGNVYRASTGNHSADLTYYDSNPGTYLGRGYMKTSNQTENDWSDLMSLAYAFSRTFSDAEYFEAMSTNVNVEAWMRYFALGNLLNYGETSLFNGRGDDYAMYRGLKDSRFVPIGHDFDTVFGQGDSVDNPPGTGYYPLRANASIYIMLNPPNTGGGGFGGNPPNIPVLRRFFQNEVFAPVFFAELKRLCDTVFHPAQLNPLMDQLLTGWGNGPTTTTIEAMKAQAAARRAAVLAQIPLTLTVSNALPTQSGFYFSTTPDVTLYGTSHAIDTRRVLVNGVTAFWAAWDARWTNVTALRPGINQVVIQSLNSNDVEIARVATDIWYDDGSLQAVSGAITNDTVWTAANGPYNVTATVTVASGATLTIQSGTSVYFAAGASLVVANGGRLLAEGSDQARIRFARPPGSSATWGGITINGGPSSPETRITYAHVEGNSGTAIASLDGTVFLDHLTFGNTTRRYIDVNRSSFVISHCVFPAATAQMEMVHADGGLKPGGRGIFLRNFFGKTIGYNDTVDFTGGNRPGPIVQFINNVFNGSDDDLLDLDGTDAWIEGNIFLHAHRNGSPDSASGVSGGNDSGQTSEITIIGNLFYDCDHAALAKQGNYYTFVNNTVVHQTSVGSQDPVTAVVILADDGTEQGAGMLVEGNVIYDADNLTRNVTTAQVIFTNNIMHQLRGAAWTGPGGNNLVADPMLKRIPPLEETRAYVSWEEAQRLWDDFSLVTGSPATAAGPNGRDLGGVVPLGVSISGEPDGVTPRNSASLRVGVHRSTPAVGFPDGSGYTHYKWRLDGGPWSAEVPTGTPITLTGLINGQHYVEAVGRRDAGHFQDDSEYRGDALVTVSRTWTVNTGASALRLSEVLAANSGAFVHEGTTPDAIEIHNSGAIAVDLGGVRLTDEVENPDKFIFPVGTVVAAGGYLVAFANNPDGTPGIHLGFNLNQQGDGVYLFDSRARGGVLIDSVLFGQQVTDYSIGRLPYGEWVLNQPTLGSMNRAAPLGSSSRVRLNEWLALGESPFDTDFLELYNGDSLPVSLGGHYLTDEVVGWLNRHQIAPLSFVGGFGYLRFFADGNEEGGPEHLSFALSADQGQIALLTPELSLIDAVHYEPQRLNISQGRSPNGSSNIAFFTLPTPGAPNPLLSGPTPFGGALVINEVLALNSGLVEGGRTPDWVELYNGTTNVLDLSNLSLSDDTLEPRRYVFPSGTTLSPASRVRVLCDPNSTNPVPLLNTNFALRSSGGAVYLFDSDVNGGSLLDAIVYGLQIADLSIGRSPDGSTNWVLTSPTPDAANLPIATLGDPANLKVNEWLADPAPGEDDWFEIYNPNPLPVSLSGLHLTDDLNNTVKHQITLLSFIGAGTNAWQKFVADNNTGAGADHVNFGLRSAGEAVAIATASGVLIDAFAFRQQQSDVSEGRFPDGDATVIAFPGTASPGDANWRWLTNIVVNEAVTHTDSPLEDAIELRNLTAQPVDIGGWWLSDDPGSLQKYQIPAGTIVPANGFTVIYETAFTNAEFTAIPFALSSQGDEVVLSAAANNSLTGYRTSVRFGAAANGVSFGRYQTSDGREEFVAMSGRTFGVDDPGSVEEFREGTGAPNAYPRVGPIVISEIMYHPPDLVTNDNVRDEFIELRNVSTAPVSLYDPANPPNVWRLRDAVDFDFPPGTEIAPGGLLLVVSFDPVKNPVALNEFRSQYAIDPSQPIVGPYSGRLANDTDDIELRRPDAPNGADVPYILVDRVRYSDSAPWWPAADGSGFSLTRLSEVGFGNDPTNWVAVSPTPGIQASTGDFDGDGLPDSWEGDYGLDPFNPADAHFDSDGDRLTNLQEFQIGTNPRDAESALRFGSIALVNGQTVLSFSAAANVTYSVLWRESVDAGFWVKLADVAAGVSRTVSITDPLPFAPTRVYRLVSPAAAGPANPQPAILNSPRATAADFGGTTTLSVLVSGAEPLSYEWLFNGTPVPNATAPSLSLSGLDFTKVGSYQVRVSDGVNTTTSMPAYVGVRPRIVTHPLSQAVDAGQALTLNVVAEGIGTLRYLWFLNHRPIANATNATLVVDNVLGTNTQHYSVMVQHELGGRIFAARSSTAVITINPRLIEIDHVVYVSLDGLGGTYLQSYVSAAPAQFPTFVRLMSEGSYTFNARCDYDISETVPNHACMFTARPVMQPVGFPATTHHGYNNNFPGATDTLHVNGNPNVPYKSSFFDVAHDYGLSTAFYASKTRLAICDRSYDALNGAVDAIATDNGRDKIDFASVVDLNGNAISNEMNLAIASLSSAFPTNFSFIHLAEPDLTGHSSGWGSANWSNAVRMVDGQLARLLNAVTANPVLSNRTVVIVTADHGGGGGPVTSHTDSSHILNYTIPFFVWGPGIPAGESAYDLFSNRADPGTNRTTYAASPQPIRNADGANLGLALLGLPAIPGSLMIPELKSNPVPMRVPDILRLAALEAHDHGSEAELRLNGVEWANENEIAVDFSLPALQSAVVEYSADPLEGQWESVAEYSAEKRGRSVRLKVPGTVSHGFFRVRAP